MAVICKCGNQTKNADGVCFICKDEAAAKNKPIIAPKKETINMDTINIRNKVCPACNTRADSNRQETCKRCGHVFVNKKSKISPPATPPPAILTKPLTDKCSFEGCEGPIKSKGLCNKHYIQKLQAEGRLGKNKKSRSSSEASPLLKKQMSKRASEKKVGVSQAPSGIPQADKLAAFDVTYIVHVNFYRYPKLHKRLLEIAEKEFRDPGMQLLSLVYGTLGDLEAQA